MLSACYTKAKNVGAFFLHLLNKNAIITTKNVQAVLGNVLGNLQKYETHKYKQNYKTHLKTIVT